MPAPQKILRQIPNMLTCFRMILIVPFLITFVQSDYVESFYIFFIAGFTDGLDGLLARHYQWQTPLGSFIDPMADKLIVVVSFVLLAYVHQIPWWLVLLVFMRDATIAAGILFWSCFIHEKLVFSPTILSKLNTTLQLLLVVFCLFELAYKLELTLKPLGLSITHGMIILTTITTVLSYLHYVWVWGSRARHLLKGSRT